MSANHPLRELLLPLGCAVACMVSGQDTLLTLDRAIGMALENNFDIRIARNTREQAANNSSAGNAGMLPRVDANGAYTRTEGSARQELSNGQEVARDNSVSDNLNANVAKAQFVSRLHATLIDLLAVDECSARGTDIEHACKAGGLPNVVMVNGDGLKAGALAPRLGHVSPCYVAVHRTLLRQLLDRRTADSRA